MKSKSQPRNGALSRILAAGLIILSASLACRWQEGGTTPEESTTGIAPGETAENMATDSQETAGPCDNVLFPFVKDRQWTYQKFPEEASGATPDPLTSKFGVLVVDVMDSRALVRGVDLATGVTTETQVECQDGAILNFPMMTLGSLIGNYLSGDVTVTYVSGTFAPREEELEASGWNMEWTGEYIAAGTISLTSEGETTTLILEDSPLHMTWRTEGQETVTVPAGTYEEAHRVRRTTELEASIEVDELMATGTLTFETLHWFAPGVGLVKTEMTSASLTTFGIEFPIELSGSVDLFEIKQP